MALDQKDKLLAGQFRRAGLSTLSVDLLAHQEEHFPDVHNNVPLLSRRLVDFLGMLKNRMQMGEMRQQPIGVFAANATSPVAVRVAALRDHDIAAIVAELEQAFASPGLRPEVEAFLTMAIGKRWLHLDGPTP